MKCLVDAQLILDVLESEGERAKSATALFEKHRQDGHRTKAEDKGQGALDVGTWSTEAISDCIAKCKKRAAVDPEFAALVERNPAAAVKEVQA